MEEKLYQACLDGKVEEVRKLLQNRQININWQNQYESFRTPFWIACCNGQNKIVKLLLNDKRIDINKADNNGVTPFLISCWNGKAEVMKYMLESKREIDINKEDHGRQTGLDWAKQNEKTEIVNLIESFKRTSFCDNFFFFFKQFSVFFFFFFFF